MFNLIILVALIVTAIVLTIKSKKFKSLSIDDGSSEKQNRLEESKRESAGSWAFITKICAFIFWGGFVVFLLLKSLLVVSSGNVAVKKLFGVIKKDVIPQGLHFVNPLATYKIVNIQRNAITVQDANSKSPGMESTTADNVLATVEANFPYRVNPLYAWWIRKYIGDQKKVIAEVLDKAAQSATRDALATYKLEGARVTERKGFEKLLTEQFGINITNNLPKKTELTDAELATVFEVLPVQLMNVIADPKVSNALSEKKATEITLDYQKTLTSIMAEQANRRGQEGKGIKNLFAELPTGYSASDVALILNATANKERADAQLKAVTDGKVSVMIVDGGGSVSKNFQ